jgi:serine/threonine-protein kinase
MRACEHCGQEHEQSLAFCPFTGKILEPERHFAPGLVVDGKYRLRRLLGTGGVGAVYEAEHVMLHKAVAVKLLLPEMAREEEMLERMLREAQAASSTGHRNVVLVTDLGWTDQRTPYLVMEYLEGQTLRELVSEQGAQSVERAASLLYQVLTGLAAVHRRGIVHRDLKPDNLMIVRDEEDRELVKILDFGIAKILGKEDLALTRPGVVVGTPRFMAPERIRGAAKADPRNDIYSVGALLYTLLAGRQPFDGKEYREVALAILEGKLGAPSEVTPGIPAAIDEIVARATAVDPDDRFPDAVSFRDALEPFADAELVVRSQPPPSEPEQAEGQAPRPPAESAPRGKPGSASPLPLADTDQLPPPVELSTEPLGAGAETPIAGKLAAGDAASSELTVPRAEADLELDTEGAWHAHEADAPPAPLHKPGRVVSDLPRPARVGAGKALAVIVAIATLGALAAVAWHYRDELREVATDSDTVQLTFDVTPAGAKVFVAGERAKGGKIRVPRSKEPVVVVIDAVGHETKILEIRPTEEKRVRVKLRPLDGR